jgi:hypothetical protein
MLFDIIGKWGAKVRYLFPQRHGNPNPDKPVVAKRKSRFIGELTNDEWRFLVSLRSVFFIKIDRSTQSLDPEALEGKPLDG